MGVQLLCILLYIYTYIINIIRINRKNIIINRIHVFVYIKFSSNIYSKIIILLKRSAIEENTSYSNINSHIKK